MEYVFKSERGYCPHCVAFGKIYFIQDRYIGGEKYEFALMSRPSEKKAPQKFEDVKKMVSSLVHSEISDDIAANLLLSQMTEYQCGSYRLIEKGGMRFVWDNLKKELREYAEPKQETGYCDTYLECLRLAKEILKQRELECDGMQMSMFNKTVITE